MNEISKIDHPTSDQKERYIRALANIGDFETAYKLTKDKFYKEVLKALDGKAKKCKCKGSVQFELIDGVVKETEHSPLFVKQQVFTGTQYIDIIQCNKCGRVTCDVNS